jgi:hypothetical protein
MLETTEEGLNLAEFLHNDREKGKNGTSINGNNKRERENGESSGMEADSSCGGDMPPLMLTYPENSMTNSGVVNLNKVCLVPFRKL